MQIINLNVPKVTFFQKGFFLQKEASSWSANLFSLENIARNEHLEV